MKRLGWIVGGLVALGLLVRRKPGTDIVAKARGELEAIPSDYTANLLQPSVGAAAPRRRRRRRA